MTAAATLMACCGMAVLLPLGALSDCIGGATCEGAASRAIVFREDAESLATAAARARALGLEFAPAPSVHA